MAPLIAWAFLSFSTLADRHPTIYIYNGQAYYSQENYWYGPGWYYGHWFGSEEAYWIWRRRYPYWWDRYYSTRDYYRDPVKK